MKKLKHFLTTQYLILSKTSKYKYQYEMKTLFSTAKVRKKFKQTSYLFKYFTSFRISLVL